jgi:hypothetical protein
LCKSPLEFDKAAQELICHADKLAYPVRDGIPIMWADQARPLVEGTPGGSPGNAAGSAAGSNSGGQADAS